MYILGLNIGHSATACLLKDGKIIGCVSEERFSRIKNHAGLPKKSIDYLLKEEGITLADINSIVLDDHYPILDNPDYGKVHHESYTKKSRLKHISFKVAYKYPNLYKKYKSLRGATKDKDILKQELSEILNYPKEKIKVIDHHYAHSLSPCFNLPKNEKTLIFTLDGEGSESCATINIFDGKNMETIARSNKIASVGNLYGIATIILGMKPLQHEFKVMGLAPYAKEESVNKIYNKFKELIWIDENLNFQSKFSMAFSDYFFKEEMKFVRFDNIAGAVQKLVEELSTEWIRRAIEKTGIHNIALSGGVFMNVKANQKISEMPEVHKIFVMPSSGDESNAIGCSFFGYQLYCKENIKELNVKPIEDLYLGPSYDDKYIEKMIQEKNLKERYEIKKVKNINQEVAKLLSQGYIVARSSGKSEWGARALGNRSILANPKNKETIKVINELIKDRDFWMPFTPSILDKFEKIYIKNPKKISAPYMVITFNSTEKAQNDLPAAMHPYDLTVRPQVVTKKYNKDYYEIIEKFQKLTGIGGILNTSFNLHGEPNVLTPEDAIHTVDNSGLRYLACGNYLFKKKD
ncbi:MAG: carbamoyltransferase C-terminal domain-containing protein [Candidatus Pacearchaeota archaeon]|jgi:carbamoyltransferase